MLSRLMHGQAYVNYFKCWFCSQHILAVYRARAKPCLSCGKFGTLSEDGLECVCDPGTFGPTCIQPKWTPWSKWSACSVSCGDGSIRRTRQCNAPEAYACPDGSSMEEDACNEGLCASEWSDWSSCSVSCSMSTSGQVILGAQSRGRICLDDANCEDVSTEESRDCREVCPIACPTADPFDDCSGHGICVLTPEEGCTQAATCRCYMITAACECILVCLRLTHACPLITKRSFVAVLKTHADAMMPMYAVPRVRVPMAGLESTAA